MPTPGVALDEGKFKAWREKAIAAWAHESANRGTSEQRGLEESDAPESLWLYLYERILEAVKLPEFNLPTQSCGGGC